MTIIFFGSTSDSVLVLEKLFPLGVSCIVTQPARPVGRKQVLTPTPVEIWAKAHDITVLSFPSDSEKPWLYASEEQVVDALMPFKADLIVSACYGQKIPEESINAAHFGGLNVHPSVLPRWRGADPVPWAIYSGDHQTGVTVVTLARKFDDGKIIAQKKIPITDKDTSDTLRTKLFTMGADLLVSVLPDYLSRVSFPRRRESMDDGSPIRSGMTRRDKQETFPYARRLTRDDGFEPWEAIQKAFHDLEEARRIDRKFRAFFPWPGLWTLIQVKSQKPARRRGGSKVKSEEKRLKILSLHLSPTTDYLLLDTVQWEGKKPVEYSTLLTGYGERLH